MTAQTTSNSTKKLAELQVEGFFPTGKDGKIDEEIAEIAFQRTVMCINSIKGWNDAGFDRLISWQYATYLYFLSREVALRSEDSELATRLFLLNKALNAVEMYFQIELPDCFFLSHTTGLVFGQATYGNNCVFHQGCTVGRNGHDRPILEEGVILYPNSSVIGRCLVRENTVIAPGVQLVNQDTPGNCYVFMGEKGRPVFKELKEYYSERYFERAMLNVGVVTGPV